MLAKRVIPAVFLAVFCVALVGQAQETGNIMYEIWDGIGGTAVADLTGNPNFPDNPTSGELLTLFESPTNRADNFGGRIYGWVYPPETADYTFWLAADDGAEVWLSTDDDPANAVLMVAEDSWGGSRDWFDRGQKSDPVALVAGEKYYIEGLYKEGGGGDNIAVAWQINADPDPNATIDPNDIVVIPGEYLSPAPWAESLLTPSISVPADGAVDVALDVTAEWGIAAPLPATYQIYLSLDDVIDAADLIAEMPDTSASGDGLLEEGTTYYLRVDAVDAEGTVRQSPVTMFTTIPVEAHFPDPIDGQMWTDTDITLSWVPGLGALVHNVFLSTDQALVDAKDPSVQVGQWLSESSFTAAGLEPDTTYFWAVDEFLGAVTNPGPTWSFTTYDPNGGAVAQYWDNRDLAGDPLVVTTVGDVDFPWGSGDVNGVNSPDPNIPTDNFSCRWTAELNVPVTGTYTIFAASDDGSRAFLNGEQIVFGNWSNHGTVEVGSDPLELTAGDPYVLVMEMYEAGGGATAFLRWEGPGVPKQIIPQGALQLPTVASNPGPASGATGVSSTTTLSWLGGFTDVQYDVYLGTDADLVAAGDASALAGRVDVASLVVDLPWNTAYYWKVDGVAADGTVTPALFVWDFITEAARVIDDFSMYVEDPIEPVGAPLALYTFEDGTLDDSSGNGNHGVAVGDVNNVMVVEDPNMGMVLSLPGGDNTFVDCGDVGLSGNDPTTIGVWAKADHTDIPNWTLIFGFTGTDSGEGGCGSHFNVGSLGGPGGIGAHAWCWEETMVSDEVGLEWNHYAMTYDGTRIEYYTNGMWMDTDPGKTNVRDLSIRADRVYIGNRITHNNSFPGDVDDCVVYGYTLTSAEIAGLAGVAAENLVSGAWMGTGTASKVGSDMCLTDAEVSLMLEADVLGADAVAVMVMGDGVKVTVEDAAGATKSATVGASDDWQQVEVPLAGLDAAAIAKITIKVDGTAYVASVKAVADNHPILVNPSFEEPGTIKHKGFGDVPGWSTDWDPIASGVEAGFGATDGEWTAYLKGGDPSVFNLTDETIRAAGETFVLTLDARRISTGSSYDGKQKLTMGLYAAGSRIALATKTVGLKTSMKTFSVTFTAPADSEVIGSLIGIELSCDQTLWIGVDNVRLVRKYLDGVDD